MCSTAALHCNEKRKGGKKKNDGKEKKKTLTLTLKIPLVSDQINLQIQRTLAKHDVPAGVHHQECPIRLGKFSRMRNYSIQKLQQLSWAWRGQRARRSPRAQRAETQSQHSPALLQTAAETTAACWWINWQRRLESWSSSSSLQRGWSARMATRWSSHHPACSIRYQSLHVSSSANDSFKKFTGARSRRPHHSHFSHGRQNRRSSFCRCRTVREEVRNWWQSRGLQSLCLPICILANRPDLVGTVPISETKTRRPARRPKKADSSRFVPIDAQKHDLKPAFCLFSLFFSWNSSFFCVFLAFF